MCTALAVGIALCALPGSALAADEPVIDLMPETRVRISVIEWLPTEGEYKEWSALAGEFTISTAGTVDMPLVGSVPATGSVDELGIRIGAALQRVTGLTRPPSASVQVIAYPPVYLDGEVERPGAVEFTPGLTVAKAVALAGGRERSERARMRDPVNDRIRYTGELQRLALEQAQQLARLARLHAELEDAEDITFPSSLAVVPGVDAITLDAIRSGEVALLKARRDALQRELASLADLETLLQQEIVVLDEKIEAQTRQVEIARDDLQRIAKLVKSQTVVATRQSNLERLVADLDSSRLDLVVAAMRARQKLSETRRDAIGVAGLRRIEINSDIQIGEARLAEAFSKQATARQLLLASGAEAEWLEEEERAEALPSTFLLIREGNPVRTIAADEQLVPGDLVRVNVADNSAAIGDSVRDRPDLAVLRAGN